MSYLKSISIPVLVITLALGALMILFTPDTSQAGTCTCTTPPNTLLTKPANNWGCDYFIPGCKYCLYNNLATTTCQCRTGCKVWNIGNSCNNASSYYDARTELCWVALFVWSQKKVCNKREVVYRPKCVECQPGSRLSNGRCS